MRSSKYDVSAGHCRKLGATIEKGGVNFAIWCEKASVMELLLFKSVDDDNPDIIELSSLQHFSTYYWHVFVPGIKEGQHYGWRVKEIRKGVSKTGLMVDTQKVLLDPYGLRIVFPKNYNRTLNQFVGSNVGFCAKSVVVDPYDYDWEDDVHPKIPLKSNIIYEMHVAGFTKHESSGLTAKIRGTYKGVIKKIPYLKKLGINAVELLPIFQFDENDASPGRKNYWGYSPMGFFSVHEQYSSDKSIMGPLNEFRDMVKALHKAGIEVILDVVYNHTSEGDHHGPLYCFKGLDNQAFYILDEHGNYKNYSGCGNTINSSHPMVKRLITDSLHYWTEIMHVDGFRFDLACILSRDVTGEPLNDPPTTLAISTDNRLAHVKLIAEPWDAAGMYQVGKMAGAKWREWNGIFRDDLRGFLRGDNGLIKRLVNRLLGSPDIYDQHRIDSQKSVNFVTCHDGFTLWDLVSYNQKHNEANGENNRDGCDHNISSNYGVEGPTSNKDILKIRLRQAKNFFTLSLFAQGTPMILMGDEVLRTQNGNNNAYCQDSDVSYLKWEHTPMQEEMLDFVKTMIQYRKKRGIAAPKNIRTLADVFASNFMTWHGIKPNEPDWSDTSHSIGLIYYSWSNQCYIYVFINAYWEGLHIELPTVPGTGHCQWHRLCDTSLEAPYDVVRDVKSAIKIGHSYYLESRSILVLCSDKMEFR